MLLLMRCLRCYVDLVALEEPANIRFQCLCDFKCIPRVDHLHGSHPSSVVRIVAAATVAAGENTMPIH